MNVCSDVYYKISELHYFKIVRVVVEIKSGIYLLHTDLNHFYSACKCANSELHETSLTSKDIKYQFW